MNIIPIYIASDHRGYELKEKLIGYLSESGYKVSDEGAFEYKEWDDYIDYVVPLANKIQEEPETKGIVICMNGVGVSIVANKFKDVRAGLCFNSDHVESAIKDDNINVLAIPATFVSQEEARKMVKAFLETDFSNQERHIRRLDKISDVERQNFK